MSVCRLARPLPTATPLPPPTRPLTLAVGQTRVSDPCSLTTLEFDPALMFSGQASSVTSRLSIKKNAAGGSSFVYSVFF